MPCLFQQQRRTVFYSRRSKSAWASTSALSGEARWSRKKMRQAVIFGLNMRPVSFFRRMKHRFKTILQLLNVTLKQQIVSIPGHNFNWAACMLWVGGSVKLRAWRWLVLFSRQFYLPYGCSMASGVLCFHGRGVQSSYGVTVECHTNAANQGDVAL